MPYFIRTSAPITEAQQRAADAAAAPVLAAAGLDPLDAAQTAVGKRLVVSVENAA